MHSNFNDLKNGTMKKSKEQIISEASRRISNGEFVDEDIDFKAWTFSLIIFMISVFSLLILIL